jgi:hypothetical protein
VEVIMKLRWEDILSDNTPLCEIQEETRMEKTAGVFMRPSDIGGHTELADSLESLLNGTPGGGTFKDAPGDVHKTASRADSAISASVGALGGYMTHRRFKNAETEPPEDTKGFSNKLQDVKHRTAQMVKENPVATGAFSMAVGGLGGHHALKGVVKRIRSLNRDGG